LVETRSSDKIFKRLTDAEKACMRAKDLTYQLLTFSKGGAPVKKTVSLDEIMHDAANFALAGSLVRSEILMPGDLWPVEADPGQMSQVANNLLLNACEAMPDGGLITISAENLTIGHDDLIPGGAGRYVKVSIRDQGVGIPKEHLQRIFEPYFTTKHKGSGLGLSICYSIIKNHDGYITAESTPGLGTTFHVTLPASLNAIPLQHAGEGEPVPGEGRILVMDDEAIVRDVAGQMLTHLGYEVEFAQDGAEAIDLYSKAKESGAPFDAVIMDLTVPGGMGGKEAVQRLLTIDPDVKAVVSSGYSDNPVMSDFRRFGFSGVVAKPYKVLEMSRVLSQILKNTP
jgi:CheY-like chemotaxis protein